MPSNSGKRTYEMTTNKWGGRNQRRDDRRPNVQNRISGGSRLMVNPWENGVAPGMQPSLLGQGSFAQPFSSSYLMNSGMNRGSFGAASYGGGFGSVSNKSRLDRMGGFDDQRGRGLLPSPSNAPLLGVAPPQAYVPPGRGTDFLQRMSNPWDSFRSGGPRGLNSGYYPSNRMRQDNNSRKFLKAKRPQNRSSTSSTSKSGDSKEVRGGGSRNYKGSTSSKSPSYKEKGEDKDSSSSSHSKSGKQGDTPIKRERSDKDDDDEEEEEEEEDEGEKEEGSERRKDTEGDEKTEEDKEKDEERRERERQQQEDQFPVEALYCHICELDSFSTKKGYIRHLQGMTHAKMAEMFHAKNAATLELLNISAKLAEMRQRDKVLRRTGKKNQPVMKTTEQMLVQKWLKVGSCCGTKYKSPFGLEEHKLSIHHLKAKFTQKQKQEEAENPEKTEDENEEGKVIIKKEPEEPTTATEESHDDVIRVSCLLEKSKKEAEENPLTMHDFPVYNPGTMMGLEYVSKELRFRCEVCKNQGFRTLESHCQSFSHYDNITSHLNKIEDTKREEKRKQEEAEAEAKREQERQEREKEREREREEKLKREKEEREKQNMEVLEEENEANISAEYITVDQCTKDKSDDEEEMDEDAILLGEEEERILNAKEEEEEEREEEEEEEEEEEAHEVEDESKDPEEDEEMMDGAIFEEVGEKIDFEEDVKKQIENGDEKEEEEEEEEEEAREAEPPQKKSAVASRGRRGRSRGRRR